MRRNKGKNSKDETFSDVADVFDLTFWKSFFGFSKKHVVGRWYFEDYNFFERILLIILAVIVAIIALVENFIYSVRLKIFLKYGFWNFKRRK